MTDRRAEGADEYGHRIEAANARLIAAAPELAEALEEAEDVLSDLAKLDWIDDRVHQALKPIRAALRKAGVLQ